MLQKANWGTNVKEQNMPTTEGELGSVKERKAIGAVVFACRG